ncbi:proteasome non-ATPase 26S subunit domain-containing protein [Ditylenchus destructor]|uniref:26S proteasome non-ATPase regulatory subunit 5 n=1 Tax=Ditylenchus destructor TaxID=166010 RepID=A0AAD4RDX1_9BILA|nr:proteasome non-ATPase 26S subunit domain-containing protein [Ditylenchus destructor]
MEVDSNVDDDWTIERVLKTRDDFVRTGQTIENAITFLNKLSNVPAEIDIDVDDSEYWPDICELLGTLLKTVPVDLMLTKHQIVILSLINRAPQRIVGIIAADYIKPALSKCSDVLRTSALAVLIALSRRITDRYCNEAVASLICHFVDVKEVQVELQTQLKKEASAIKRFNIYQVAHCAMIMEDFANYDSIRFIIDSLATELDGDDLLSCITALEELADMASSRKANAKYLNDVGLLDKTYKMFLHSKDNPDGGLIHSACVRFFGYLSVINPDALTRFNLFTQEIFDQVNHFDQLDPVRRQLAFDTLALITTSSNAKQLLTQRQSPYNIHKAMNHFGVAIGIAPDEMRVRHLHSLKMMMSASQNETDSEILNVWFKELGDPFPNIIYAFMKKPFEDLNLACWDLLLALLQHHKWALPPFCRVEGFNDLLLDRNTYVSAQVSYLKYDVIRYIVDTSRFESLDDSTIEKLKKYKEEGVFSPMRADVAIDWGNG